MAVFGPLCMYSCKALFKDTQYRSLLLGTPIGYTLCRHLADSIGTIESDSESGSESEPEYEPEVELSKLSNSVLLYGASTAEHALLQNG